MNLYDDWETEIITLGLDGVRIGVDKTHDYRNDDMDYDPWLRTPINIIKEEVKNLTQLYYEDKLYSLIYHINKGGINHINRLFFQSMWKILTKDFNNFNRHKEFANLIEINCTDKVKILFKQSYAHRLFELGDNYYSECLKQLNESIILTKLMLNETWDKWLISGYFFLARYSKTNEDKCNYCIKTLLEPRNLKIFSPHIKYWKLFKAAAWLTANDIKTDAAKLAIQRFKDLKFRGYKEFRIRHGNYECTTLYKEDDQLKCILDSKEKCLNLMSNDITHISGNP